MDKSELQKDFPGICQIIWDGNQIKVKSKIENWRDEKDFHIDKITQSLSDLAEEYGLSKDNSNDCLLAYSYDNNTTKTAEEIAEEKKIILNEINSETEQKAEHDSSLSEDIYDEVISIDDLNWNEKRESLKISNLFKVPLELPSYQRPYRWDQKNIEFFWNDIKSSKAAYDFGIIVLVKNKDDKFDIVDGQQRIVTLSLMLRSLSSHVADSFISNTTLQGRDSEKHIGYNLQWFRRQVAKLENQQEMIDKILNGYVDTVVMDNLDEALKFFDRMNTSGVALTKSDILKSHHLLALSEPSFKLTPEAKKRWEDFADRLNNPNEYTPKLDNPKEFKQKLDNPVEFKRGIVKMWESYDPWWLNKRLAIACALRWMIQGQHPDNMNEIGDIELLRRGNNPKSEYTGLDSPIADGEFFFWYVFNLYRNCAKIFNERKEYDSHAVYLRNLLFKPKAKEFFDILIVYIHEKFPDEAKKAAENKTKNKAAENNNKNDEDKQNNFNKLEDLIFSWLVYFCLYQDSLQFSTIRNDAMNDGSLFKAIVKSSTLEDCFDCYSENPLDLLERNGLGDRVSGNGNMYLIRRELRRIYD